MAGPIKHTTPCVSLSQLSNWLGQLAHCVTPPHPASWQELLDTIPSSYLDKDVQIIYEPINLRATLWGIKKKHPLVDLALENMDMDLADCTFIVKDATIPGKNGLFRLYCNLVECPLRDSVPAVVVPGGRGIYSAVQIDEESMIAFCATRLEEEEI